MHVACQAENFGAMNGLPVPGAPGQAQIWEPLRCASPAASARIALSTSPTRDLRARSVQTGDDVHFPPGRILKVADMQLAFVPRRVVGAGQKLADRTRVDAGQETVHREALDFPGRVPRAHGYAVHRHYIVDLIGELVIR